MKTHFIVMPEEPQTSTLRLGWRDFLPLFESWQCYDTVHLFAYDDEGVRCLHTKQVEQERVLRRYWR